MSRVLLTGGYFLIIIWAIGFFLFHLGWSVHILLAIAIIAFIFRLLYNKSFVR